MPEQDDKVDPVDDAPPASGEPRARDLLPPDDPPAEAAPKRIAERRVVGWSTSSRLTSRRVRRPAGNSKQFWKRIEEDDPFLPPPKLPRATQVAHDQLYPGERLQRIPESQRPPPVAQPRPPAQPRAPAQPRPPAQPRQQQEPVHTHDPRPAAPDPRPRPPQPEPPPSPPARAEAPPPQGERRLPPFAPNPEVPGRRRSTGRMRVSTARTRQQQQQEQPPSQAEVDAAAIRAKKAAERAAGSTKPPPPKARGIDDVLALLGDLKMAEELHNAGVTGRTDTDMVDAPAPRPAPRPAPSYDEPPPPRPAPKPRPSQQTAPSPPPQQPAPPAQPAPPRPTPPRPTPPRPTPPASEPPSPAGSPASAGNLDDLFGGGPQEGRVRIGRRSKPKAPKPDES